MSHPLSQWLGYRDRLPLAVERLPATPDETLLQHWRDTNLRTLTAVATLDERHLHADSANPDPEMERMHQKLDLLLELVATLVRGANLPIPDAVVLLTREGVAWPQHLLVAPPGSCIRVEIGLHPCAPQRFVWAGEVIGQSEEETCLRFLPMGDAQEAALERYVFRRHRRSVAGARLPDERAGPAH